MSQGKEVFNRRLFQDLVITSLFDSLCEATHFYIHVTVDIVYELRDMQPGDIVHGH